MKKWLYAGLVSLGLAYCHPKETSILVLPTPEKTSDWRAFEPAESGLSKIFTNASVAENQLRLMSLAYFYTIDGASKRYRVYSSGTLSNPYDRGVFSENMFASMNYGQKYISISNAQNPVLSGASTSITLDYDYQPTFQQYERFRFKGLIGAFNKYYVFMTSVVKKNEPNKLCFILNPIKKNGDYLSLDLPQVREVVLPDETNPEVYTMEAFQRNFLISTGGKSYLLRPDGTFKAIFNERALDYFFWREKLYADLGTKLYSSVDDGETWTLVKDDLRLPTPREFAPIQDELVCYKQDTLFHINPTNFSYRALKNKGFATNQITSASFFLDSVYVGTLNGVFVKSKKDCFDDK
jgi:hypothetical protein